MRRSLRVSRGGSGSMSAGLPALGLALLLALGGCTGGEATATPTRSAAQSTARANARIVTDLSELKTTPAPTVTATPLPPVATSTPLPVARLELLSFRSYRDAAGSLLVVGEAQNTGDTQANGVDFKVSLLGADDKPLATTWATVHLAQVAPGGKTPFRAVVAQPPKEYAKIAIDATAAAPDPKDAAGPTFVDGLQVEHAALATTGGKVSVGGSVKNGGQTGALAVRVLAVLRGADGKVVDVADAYAQQSELAAGKASPFSVQFYDGKAEGPFEVFVQGRYAARQ